MKDLTKNAVQDLEIKYKANTYEFIEKILNQDTRDVPALLFMLSLLGLVNEKRVPIDATTKDEGTHAFSIRTMYIRSESDIDAYVGLIAILDNLELSPDLVINSIAFERTGFNGTPYLKMQNVKTFFEYMLGGIDVFCDKFFIYGKDNTGIVDAMHDYLISDLDETEKLLRDMLLEEAASYE